MRFSEAWLREWVSPPTSTRALSSQLTMAGLEVDSVEPAAPPFSGVVVGRIVDVRPHPSAERLKVCSVDAGDEPLLQIVCGAPNVRSGMLVPTALVGAKLADGTEIGQTELRAVESNGMLCSAAELGLAEKSEGLLELPADLRTGENLRATLDLDDNCIDVDLTPNRGDCLSIAGIAREVGVVNRCTVAACEVDPVEPSIDDGISISGQAPADCPRYLGRVIRGITPGVTTPLWMQERLRRSGLRSLGPVVDVTNYVLLELGQPMHAFDLRTLNGGIVVRRGQQGETLTLLDGQQVNLSPDSLVIADQQRAVALAGIMGGADTAVTDATRDLMLECAYFSPLIIAGRARSYGLHTDASHRYERGVDPELQHVAMERASALLLEIVGGQAGPIVEYLDESGLPQISSIPLRKDRICRLLGVDLPGTEIVDILERLGMTVNADGGDWIVRPPSYRFDIAIEADLIEELGRVHGYDRIPTSPLHGRMELRDRPETEFSLARAKDLLVGKGYHEAVVYSFVDPNLQARIYPDRKAIPLSNPISSELSVMRTGLWPGLLQALLYNRNRQQERVRLFESGLRFLVAEGEIVQEPMLAGVAIGDRDPEQWAENARTIDFFDVKADVQAILTLTGAPDRFAFRKDAHPALHPGQCARIWYADQEIGWLGMLHPRLERELGTGGHVFLFELHLRPLTAGRLPKFQPLSRYPSIRRDLAIVIDDSVTADSVRRCVTAAASEVLSDLRIFDVYRGDRVETGRKSLALGLILQDSCRTLTDLEVDRVIESVLDRLGGELGATLRE